MFGLNKLKKLGSSSGLIKLDDLKSAHESTKERDDKRKDNYSEIYNEALNLIDRFIQNPQTNLSSLEQAAYNLIDALHLVKDRPEPYLLLAYIFYMMGDENGALKYLQVCNSINPNAAGIGEIKDLISGKSKKPIGEPLQNQTTSPIQEQNINKAINNVQKIGPPTSIRRIQPIIKKN
jgi:hypothetical protein